MLSQGVTMMNIFQQFIVSLYSPKKMAMFRFQGIGKTILYIFFLALFTTLPIVLLFYSFSAVPIEKMEQILLKEFPDFTIKNGTLHSSNMETVKVESENWILLYDPSGQVTEFSNKNITIGLLSDQFIIVTEGNVQSIPYSMLEGLHVTKKSLVEMLHQFQTIVPILSVVIIIITYIFNSGLLFIKIAIFAGLALLLRQNRKLSYRQSYRITAYGVTLPTILFTLLSLFQINFTGDVFLEWAMILFILYRIISSIPSSKQPTLTN
jgi:Protein of unknown function (DUF1189)